MTTEKLTPKQRRFVEEYLIDLNGTQAAIRAGYSQKTANPQAARLLANVSIQAAIEDGFERHRDRLDVTVESISRQLDQDRAFAYQVGHAGAAISATMGKAKLFGLLTDKHELTGKNGGPIQTASIDVAKLDDREIAELERLLAIADRSAGGDSEAPPQSVH